MQTIRAAILGMNRLGGSFGLALKAYTRSKEARQQFEVTAYDPDDRLAQRARALGAADAAEARIEAAVAGKAIVIIALPYHEAEAAYQLIGRAVQAGAVLLDAAPFKAPSLAWAAKHLHKEAFAIGFTPIVNARFLFDGLDDLEHAAADLFTGSTMLIAPPAKADRDAVQLAADLAAIVGASPRFTDPAEHDTWTAATEALPAAVSVAAFEALSHQSHWDDVKRVANPAFGQLTHHLLEMHPDALRDLMLRDREGLIRQIDALTETLAAVRAVLAANDRAALEALLIRSSGTFSEWLARRRTGEWDKTPGDDRDGGVNPLMAGMFGSAIAKRLSGGGNKDR